MLDVVTQWVSHFGYVLVALFLFIEGAGVPVPGETALVTAAALAGRGTLSLVGVMVAGAIGTILGGHTGYFMGARGGTAFVKRYGKWIRLTPERLEKTHKFFEQHGPKTVLLGRFVAFVRSFVGIFAGISQMPLPIFAAYNALGGSIWVVSFSVLGYAFGRNLPRLVHYIGRVSLLLALLIALIVGVVFLWRWFGRNRNTLVASMEARWKKASDVVEGPEHHTRWEMLSGRHARGEYLAVHLAIGFVISLAVIGIFASITEGLVDSSPLTRFDIVIAHRLSESVGRVAPRVFAFFSALGGRGAMTLLLFAGGFWFALRRQGLQLAAWFAAFIGGTLLDVALRYVVRRSELPFADVVLIGWGTGLTSGHLLGVVVGFGMLAYLLCAFWHSALAKTTTIVIAIGMVGVISLSRLFLGQAYVSDASAGLAAGLLWLTACVSGIEIAKQRRHGR